MCTQNIQSAPSLDRCGREIRVIFSVVRCAGFHGVEPQQDLDGGREGRSSKSSVSVIESCLARPGKSESTICGVDS